MFTKVMIIGIIEESTKKVIKEAIKEEKTGTTTVTQVEVPPEVSYPSREETINSFLIAVPLVILLILLITRFGRSK